MFLQIRFPAVQKLDCTFYDERIVLKIIETINSCENIDKVAVFFKCLDGIKGIYISPCVTREDTYEMSTFKMIDEKSFVHVSCITVHV